MTADADRLYRAVLEDPFDDTVRLAYADALDELDVVRVLCPNCTGTKHVKEYPVPKGRKRIPCPVCDGTGEAVDTENRDRARFVRLQVEKYRLESAGWRDAVVNKAFPDLAAFGQHLLALSTEAKGLLRDHEWKWSAPLDDIGFRANSTWVPECGWEFDRGFVQEMSTTSLHFPGHAGPVFARHPIVKVDLGDRSPWDASADHSRGMPDWPVDRSTGYAWYGYEAYPGPHSREEREDLPCELYDLLDGHDLHDDRGDKWKGYKHRHTAVRALSRACVRLGRLRAGLRPLTAREESVDV